MQRTLAAMVACLVVGAGGMWVASNFRVKFEAVGVESAPPALPTTTKAEPQTSAKAESPQPSADPPQTLPPHLLPKQPTPGIQPASGTLPLAVGAMTAAATPAAPEDEKLIADTVIEVVELLDGPAADAISYTSADLTTPLALTSKKVTLVLKVNADKVKLGKALADAKRELRVSATGPQNPAIATPTLTDATPKADLDMSGSDFDKQRVVTLTAEWRSTDGKESVPAKLTFPSAVSQVLHLPTGTVPTIPNVFNGRYADVTAMAGSPKKAELFPGFARVQVKSKAVGGQHEFTLYSAAPKRTVVAVPTVTSRTQLSGDTVEYMLKWGPTDGTPDQLLVKETLAGNTAHQVVALLVNVNALPAFPTVTLNSNNLVPVVGTTDVGTVTPTTSGRFLLGTPTVKLTAAIAQSPALTAPFSTHGKLLLFVDKQPKDFPPPSVSPVSIGVGATTAISGIDFVNDGDHVLYLVVEAGGEIVIQRTVNVRVFRGGLAVTRVSPTDFSNSTDLTVRVAFSPDRPLNQNTIVKENFTLVGDYSGAQNLLTSTPQYDEATNTVILPVTTVPQAGLYTLTILGTDSAAAAADGNPAASARKGLRDIYGNPLGGTFGDDGKVFKFTIVQPVGGTQPSQSAGVTLGTGPNVTFPEYTQFRKVPDGFNPSDRVETRVVRLYYNRDAHRVAQIVNRDVKSYNAASVDVRRRVADRARDDANAATDARKRLEGESVQAATEARAAEAKLRDLQAKLTNARNEAATVSSQLSQRQLQLEQFARAGTRDQTNIDTRSQTDTSADTAQRRLDQAQRELDRVKQTLVAGNVLETASLESVDRDLLTAQQELTSSQRLLATEFAAARFSVETGNDPIVKAAKEKVTNLEAAGRNPNLTPQQVAQNAADLATARQDLDTATQNAILRDKTLTAGLDNKAKDVQTKQLALDRKQTARTALADYPARKQEVSDAQRDLDRAKAVARGRVATDSGADASLDTASGLRAEIAKLNGIAATTTATTRSLEDEITRATGEVQAKRTKEVELNLRVREYEQRELRGREHQHRQEVSAAKADPDTYAPGKPTSDDPVEQCSISVIGEGLIQIRGPVKGLNIIRTMINQMDAPTGQVRIGVHTVQVNGERVERMDKVAASIQRYLDHSRFLTTQSAQMLRKAVTLVASRKADEVALSVAPGCSRAEQDLKYLYSFFGRDFVEELRQLDSEFLRTGNKLLSLHSMDSTSLASALFLMALAKNDIRAEILREWQGQLQTKLPEAELNFYLAGLACAHKCEACCDKKFCVLAQNAKFESFLGFFNAEVMGNDTLTPVQREFVRLAQIFKTRLVTELELKQRVMERTLLEDRMGNYIEESREAKIREKAAQEDQLKFQKELQSAIAKASVAFASVEHEFDVVDQGLAKFQSLMTILVSGAMEGTRDKEKRLYPSFAPTTKEKADDFVNLNTDDFKWILAEIDNAKQYFDRFNYPDAKVRQAYEVVFSKLPKITTTNPKAKVYRNDVPELTANLRVLFEHIQHESKQFRMVIAKMLAELRKDKPDLAAVLQMYSGLKAEVVLYLKPEMNAEALRLFDQNITPAFKALQDAFTAAQASARVATLARRPLDEKKLLDMLVDEMEDKYIELLDGTRAHTANVDNYLKALATALDDDFNTQFYQPAFRKIRTLGAGWDVQLGQIESTTVLTNNRVLGKVSPAASMEFDLPRRDIALREAFKGAKAAVQDYGALLNDPVFLSLVKAYGGMPPSAQFGGAGGGLPAVRNVLPGLPGSADEMLFAQAGSPRKEFGTNLEALIPDPAVYKFETGTGYEVRPVISPDGQAVVFNFDYLYTTDVREPVRADEKHLGRVKRHFLHTDVTLGNYEMREVSKYWVSLKAARTGQGVQMLQDIPGVGALFRPAPSASSSLQQNLIYSQAAIFPTLFDLMGLRYAPAVADIDPEFTKNDEFVVRGRNTYLRQFIFDYGASRVDDALRIMYGERRADLYRSQVTIPWRHPNGYEGPGLRQRDAQLEEGYDPLKAYPPTQYSPGMHTPIQPGRDPATDPFGPPGVPGHPTNLPARPITVPGAGHASHDPNQLMARPPGGSLPVREYTAKPLGTTVTPEPAPRVPPTRTPADALPPRGGTPTVVPPPVPTRPAGAPVEPVPLSGRGSPINQYVFR